MVFLLDLHVLATKGGGQLSVPLQLFILSAQSGQLSLELLAGFDIAEDLLQGLLVVVAEASL